MSKMLPLPKIQSPAVQAITTKEECKLITVEELKDFMETYGFSVITLAEFLGVTRQAVYLWMSEDRDLSLTNSKILRLIMKYPKLMQEF